MERLSGTRYAYTKTRVAYMVPFIFLVPSLVVAIVIYLLASRVLLNGELLSGFSIGTKILTGGLLFVGVFVTWDLYMQFLRTVSEEIWITDRDIVWVGRKRRILLKALHSDIQSFKRLGRNPEGAWMYEVVTTQGRIRFTRSLEHSDELIARIEAFLERKKSALAD